MKKLFILSVCFILAGASAQAQKIQLGLKAGADINKINGKSFKDEFSFGYQAGALLGIGITEKWGIQPEVIFSQVTADTSSNFKDVYQVNNIGDIKLQYLKIPILLNYSPNPFITFQLGPQFGKIMNSSESITNNGAGAFKNGDLSMLGGLQLNISSIKIYGRYGIGLSNLNDITSNEKWKSQQVQIGLGWKF